MNAFAIKIGKKTKSYKIYSYCGLLSIEVFSYVYKVIESRNEGHAEVNGRGFGRFFFLCLSLRMYIFYDQAGKKFLQL